MLIDSHCHLSYPEFQEDLEAVLKRAQVLGITTFLSISTKISEVKGLEDLANQHASVFYSVGVHPHEVKEEGIPTVEMLSKLLQSPKAVGIGETGLDYYYDHSPRDLQQTSFRHHIRVSREMGLPLIIHSREAEEDILRILDEEKITSTPCPGVIHCFTGTKDFATKCLDLGFYISASGITTFPKALELQEIFRTYVPLDRLLVETDAPFLAPVPHRGKRNEPSFVVHTAERIAVLKNCSLQEVEEKTTANFWTLFKKAKAFHS